MQKLNKQGAIGINQIVGIIVILLVAGIMLTVGLRTDDEMQDMIDDEYTNLSFTNVSTISIVNETGVGVTGYNGTYYRDDCALSVLYATNATQVADATTLIDAGNYTVDGCNVYFSTIETTSAGLYNSTIWNISGNIYFGKDTARYNATDSIMEGKTNISENMGLLGTIIIFGVIISVVVVAFMISGT